MTDRPDHELLRQMGRGDATAATMLWMRIAPRLLALAGAVVRDRHSAEDIVQSVFVSAVEMGETEIQQVRDLTSFLAAATRNRSLNFLRSKARESRRAAVIANLLPDRPGIVGSPVAADDELLRAIDQLDDQHREIVLLRHFAGLTFEQVAESLGENPNTTASRYRAAIALLRRVLEPGQPSKTEVRHA